VRIGTKTDLKTEKFALFESSYFVTTEQKNSRKTAFALQIRVSTPLFRLLSLVNTIPRYLNVSTCCSVFVLTCRKHCLGRLPRKHYLGETYVIPPSFRADFRFFLVARSRKSIKCELKTLFRRSTHAVPIHPQKANGSSCRSQQYLPCQRVRDCLSNSYRPGLFKFLGETISYCTTVPRPDILRNVIFSGYITFYQINTFFVNVLFLHYWKNVFCCRVKWLCRSNLAPGRSVGNPDIDYEEEW